MVNWTQLHPNFTPELQQKWIKKEFNYEQTEKWIKIGLTPYESKFATWLRDIKSKDIENFADPQWIENNTDLEQLR